MQTLADLYIKEKVAPSVADDAAMPSLDLTLLTNKIAMATSGQWEMGVSLNNSLKDGLEYGVGVLPKMKKAVTYNTGAPFGIFKSSKHLPSAMEMDQVVGRREEPVEPHHRRHPHARHGQVVRERGGHARSGRTIRPRPPFAMYKTAVIDYAMNNAVQVPWYYFNGYQGLDDILSSGIEAVWNGKTTAKDYITSIMPKLQKYFDEHKAK